MSDTGYAETVTLHPRTGTTRDSAGSSIPAYGPDVQIEDAIVYPTVASETEIGGDVVTQGMTVMWIGRPSTMPSALDELTARGTRYRVDGDASLFHNPFDGSEATEVRLLRRT